MADTAGRQMGLPLYAVLKGKTMNIMSLLNALPGAVAQGLIWGIMANWCLYHNFVYWTFADLTVDGSLCTGGAVCIMMMLNGQNVWVSMFAALLAGMVAGCVTGLLHTFMGIPAILSGILTQLGLYSINLKIMGKANQAINVDKYSLLVSLRFIRNVPLFKNTIHFSIPDHRCADRYPLLAFLVLSLAAPSVQPAAMTRWQEPRVLTPTLTVFWV